MRPEVTITEDIGTVAGRMLARAIEQVIADRGLCRLALSGGSAPGPVLRTVADDLHRGAYEKLVVTWIDERHLPLPDGASGGDWRALPKDSNLRLAWEHWFSLAPAVPTLVPMALPGSLADACAAFERDFVEQLGRLDVALLGAGPDGHIASLFPGHPGLDATGVCIAVEDSPKPPPERISFTMPILEDLDHAILVAKGEAKADMLRQAHGGIRSLPLGRYRPRGTWRWVVDPAAGSRLPHSRGSS